MSCPAFEQLSADVDGALAETEAVAVKEHLAACERCRAQRAELLLVKSTIAGVAPRQHASAALRSRLEALVPPKSTGRRRARWRLTLSAAAVVLVGIGAFLWFRPSGDGDAFAVQLVGDHVINALNRQKPIEILSGDPAVLEKWFDGKLDFAVKLPRVSGAVFVGGRLCSVGGQRVALVFVDHDGHRMSLFVMDKNADPGPHPDAEAIRGFTVCRHFANGVEYALVTDLPLAAAKTLLLSGL